MSCVKKDRSSAAQIAEVVQLPASVVSIAKLSAFRMYSELGRSTSLPAESLACCGHSGFMRLAIASGSKRFSRPSNSICLIRLLFPEPFGPAKTVRTGTPQETVPCNSRDHTVIVFTRRTRDKTHFEFAAIRLLHDIQIQLPVPIENGNAGLKRFKPGASTGSNNRCRKLLWKESSVFHI